MKKALLFAFVSLIGFSSRSQTTVSTNGNKYVLMEATGAAPVGWEPDGTVYLETIKSSIPRVICVQNHPNTGGFADAMGNAQSQGWLSAYITGYPTGTIDRTINSSAGTTVATTRNMWITAINQRLAATPQYDVSLTYTINTTTRWVTAVVTGTALANLSGDYHLNLYVVEDSVIGTGTGYNQANYYSGNSSYTGHPFYSAANPIVGFIHKQVVRRMVGGTWGVYKVTNPTASTVSTHTFIDTLPPSYNINRIRLVAVVSKYNSTNVNDREVMNAIASSMPVACPPSSKTFATLSAAGPTTFCLGDSVKLRGNNTPSGLSYTWVRGSSIVSLWGDSTFMAKQSGTYRLVITNSLGCIDTSAPVTVNVLTPEHVDICVVNTDSATGKNIIVWEKFGITRAMTYKIYRETPLNSGTYSLVGSQAANVFSTFIDTGSYPLTQSYRYRLTLVDSCGNESPMDSTTSTHKTVHITSSAGSGGSVVLNWNLYEGRPFTTAYVMQRVGTGAWTSIATLGSSVTTYTITAPPSGTVQYRIDILISGGCTPTAKGTGYGTISSNVTWFFPTSVSKVSGDAVIKTYPNPVDKSFSAEGLNKNDKLSLYDMTGRKLLEWTVTEQKTVNSFTMDGLATGTYMLKVVDENNTPKANTRIQKL